MHICIIKVKKSMDFLVGVKKPRGALCSLFVARKCLQIVVTVLTRTSNSKLIRSSKEVLHFAAQGYANVSTVKIVGWKNFKFEATFSIRHGCKLPSLEFF